MQISRRTLRPLLVVWFACAVAVPCPAQDFMVGCVVDYRNPIAPELLKKAGIRRVYSTVGIPITMDKETPVLAQKEKPQIEEFLNLYGQHGIRVLLASHYYTHPPAEGTAVDSCGRSLKIGCFRNQKFDEWLQRTIRDMAKAFSRYPAFEGFMFDDGVHVRADACYCPVCVGLFKKEHGIDPPPFEPYTGAPRLDRDDPRLLWDAFHQDAYDSYLRTQARAANSASDGLFLATIPSDSYYYGRQLNREVRPCDTKPSHGARLQRIDRIQVRDWHVFQSFPFPKVVEHGSGRVRYGVGSHLTTPSPKIVMHHRGPYIEHMGRQQFLGPAEIKRLMHTTIAEGANAICFWENARAFGYVPDAFGAIGAVVGEAGKLSEVLKERRPYPARVGLLYSTTTEILQQPWRRNTLERWRHLHSFEAMAYALTRASVQFRVILENELDDRQLSGLDVLVLTGVTHLAQPVAAKLEEAVAKNDLKLLADATCLPLHGATVCEFDPDHWFNSQLKGYRHVSYLDRQAAEIRKSVLPRLGLVEVQPLTVSGDNGFARIFKGKDDTLLAFVVNWDLDKDTLVRLALRDAHRVTDAMTGKTVAEGKSLELKVGPAGWRVLRCE